MSDRFDKWEYVDCNECQNYWNDTCDGVSKGRESVCTSFIATRMVDVPAQIKSLRERVKWLRVSVILIDTAVILHLLVHLFGG